MYNQDGAAEASESQEQIPVPPTGQPVLVQCIGYRCMAYVDWNDNIFDNTGKATGQQVYLAAFQINGTLEVDQPNDVFRHKLTIDQLPGAPGNNFLEILDTTLSSPATTQRVYLGMGDGMLKIGDTDGRRE